MFKEKEMSKRARQALVVSLVSTALISSAWADEGTLLGKATLGISLDYSSLYIWRGAVMTDESVFQPGATLSAGNLTVGIWGNMDLGHSSRDGLNSGREDSGNFTEIDYSIDWSDDVPGVQGLGYSLGAIRYDFPQFAGNPTTSEFYGGLNLDVLLSPSVTVYYDFDAVNSTYVSFGVAHSFDGLIPIEGFSTIDVSASLGWGSGSYNDFYWTPAVGRADDMLNDLYINVGVPVEVAGWTATPSVSYVTLMDNDIRSRDYDTKSDYLFAGVSFTREF